MSAAENDSLGSCQKEDNDAPPPLSIKLPVSSELSNKSKRWSDDPVDIVLLTVEDCEFLACYAYMGNPIRRYCKVLGHVHFGIIGDDDEQLKVALLKCFAGSSGPGGAQTVVKNAVMKLRPKAIFSVGCCEGLKPENTQLGDVVVSSKLTTEDFKTPVGKDIANLIKNSADGWNPPLERPDAHQVHVHRDGEIVSCIIDKETVKQLHPRAIAREMEGKGVFVAAHDLKIEWVIVKGISHFADSNKIPDESWKSHACVMAASLVFNMLNDTVVFEEWPHYKEEESPASQLKRDLPCSSSQDAKRRKISEAFPLEKCQERLKSKYDDMSKVTITPWDPSSAVHIDTIYTRLTWFKDDVKPSGVTKKKLEDYTEIFTSQENPNPKRILVYGRPGIGKSTFCKKAAYDWSQQSKQILRKFDLVLLIKLRDVCNLHDVSAILRASELLANDTNISVDSLYKYIQENQDKVLIIFDGYDEYSYDDMRESPVRDIWDRKQLSGCTVVLTMRPTPELKSSLRFEINGFDEKEQVKMFSLKFLKDDSDVKEFYEYLKKHNLTEIAEIPLLLRMLCLLWTETETETEIETTSRADIYTLFIQTMLDHLSEKEDAETFEFKKVDKYAKELSKIGKLAYDALLKGNLTLLKSELSDDLQIIINKFTEVGLCHAFKPSRVSPVESISFIHKSIQEYIAGTYLKELAGISKTDKKATFLSELDTIKKCLKMREVLKFASELSGCSACAILNNLGRVAEDNGLTEDQKLIAEEKTPSFLDVVGNEDFLMLTADIFLCCSAETRQNLFPTFLSYIGSVLLINSDQLHRIANEDLLKSTEPPNVIIFPDEVSKHPERDYRDLVSVMEDLNAVVVSSSGVKNASQFLNKYPFRPIRDFFLKKEENIMHLYFAKLIDYDEKYLRLLGGTNPFPYPTEMLKELIASPESTAQQRNKSDAHQSSEQNTRTTVCSTRDTDSTSFPTHHCLSLAWYIKVLDSHNEDEMRVVTEVVPLVIAPRKVFIEGTSDVFKYWNINFTDKLDTLGLTLSFRDDIAAFATSMRQSPNLRKLTLSASPLGKGVSVLTSLLSCVPDLQHLNLDDVMMTKQQVHGLTTAVHQSKISELWSLYHDSKGNPLPEDEWPSEDYWKENPWLVPLESEDKSGSSAKSEDEPWSSAESKDEPGSSAEPKDEPGSSAESKDEPGSSAKSRDKI